MKTFDLVPIIVVLGAIFVSVTYLLIEYVKARRG